MSRAFIRRSLLYIPGSSLKMLQKAKETQADSVILDLEDAVSITEKEQARGQVAELLPALRGAGKEIIVRINAMDTIWAYRDLTAIAPLSPDAVIVPKADEHALAAAGLLLSALEREAGLEQNSIRIIPLFETAYAIANAYRVLGASSRVDGVQLGAEDLTKELMIARTPEGAEIRFARDQLVMAARAHGLDILDTPYTGIRDLDGLRADARTAKSIGFTGKTCIHPSHITVIHEVFSPTQEEVSFAHGVLEAFTAAVREGKGACMYQNKMVDAPVAERAGQIIRKAGRIAKTQ